MCSSLSQNFPAQPLWQMHCQGWWQVPCWQPGILTQRSQCSPSQPGSHLQEPSGAQQPWARSQWELQSSALAGWLVAPRMHSRHTRFRQRQPLGMVSSGLRRDGRMNGQTCRHLRLGGDASPGRRVKPDPTDWAGGREGGRP